MDLNMLLGRGMLDPIAVGERVFQHLQDRLPSNGILGDISDKPPEELIATALGDWLARMFVNEDSPAAADGPTAGGRGEEWAYKELADRNTVLAAALGACGNCWGTHADCPVCGGAGVPGWVLPDEELFAGYVRPAVHALKETMERSEHA